VSDTRKNIELYWHSGHDSDAAYLVSTTGKRADAKWLPKSLAEAPADTTLLRVADEQVERGVFHVEHWKLKDLGFSDTPPDARQGSLFG
jgi:hypothetical protein